jgi:molybdopterin synthase catalytic subunit
MKIHIEFTHTPILPPPVKTGLVEIGASLEFSGVVREMENGKKIPGLFYEAYEPMARKTLETIMHDLAKSHACDEIYFIHRLGFVPVGETSLFVRVLSGHRQPGLNFMAALIDRLKADVPVWKRADNK